MTMRRIFRALHLRLRAARALRTARAATETRLRAGGIRRVLVVCYGNIYRSAYLGEFLRTHGGAGIDVRSAGFHQNAGRASPPRHVDMCRRRGISLDAHRSCVVTAGDLEWADTIVLMDRHNWAALEAMGAAPAKMLWAGALAGGDVEIHDPYGKDDAGAERILGRLEAAARRLVEELSKTEVA
jgi:protein-tyrosine-phosphatase